MKQAVAVYRPDKPRDYCSRLPVRQISHCEPWISGSTRILTQNSSSELYDSASAHFPLVAQLPFPAERRLYHAAQYTIRGHMPAWPAAYPEGFHPKPTSDIPPGLPVDGEVEVGQPYENLLLAPESMAHALRLVLLFG